MSTLFGSLSPDHTHSTSLRTQLVSNMTHYLCNWCVIDYSRIYISLINCSNLLFCGVRMQLQIPWMFGFWMYLQFMTELQNTLLSTCYKTLYYWRLFLLICDDYATEYSVAFNANKSKCTCSQVHIASAESVNQWPIFYVGVIPWMSGHF